MYKNKHMFYFKKYLKNIKKYVAITIFYIYYKVINKVLKRYINEIRH